MSAELLLPALAYLVGSLPFSFWVVRLVKGIDVRTVGSGNAGATNVLRSAGRGPAVVALVLDVLKGVAAVLAARVAAADPATVGFCATAVVLGHVFPVFLGFRGGKGVATAGGALGVLSPTVSAAVLLVFVATAAVTRFVSLASIVAAVSFPFGLWIAARLRGGSLEGEGWLLLNAVLIAGLITFKHRENIGRLLQGRENKLGGSASESEKTH